MIVFRRHQVKLMSETNSTSRHIKTFGTRLRYVKKEGQWFQEEGQQGIDDKVNEWVDETQNVIIDVSHSFVDHVVSESLMYTDYLYVITYESQEDFLRGRQQLEYDLRAPEPVGVATPEPTAQPLAGLTGERPVTEKLQDFTALTLNPGESDE